MSKTGNAYLGALIKYFLKMKAMEKLLFNYSMKYIHNFIKPT